MLDSSAAGLILLSFILLAPGLITYLAFFSKPDGGGISWLEATFFVLFSGLIVAGWFGIVLAEIGFFSVSILTALVFAYTASVMVIFRRRVSEALTHVIQRPFSSEIQLSKWHAILPIMVLLVAALLFFRPHEMIRGGLDAGVYVNTGVSIVKHGSIVYRDPFVAGIPKEQADEVFLTLSQPRHPVRYLRMAGFYLADMATGEVQPQFYHLYSTLLALAFSTVGLQWGLYLTPFLGLLAMVALFLLVKRLFGQWVALLSLSFVVLTGPQIWFSRYPNSEILTQMLLLGGLCCLLVSTDLFETGAKWQGTASGALSGLAIGATALARADFIFTLVPVIFYFLYIRLVREWKPAHGAFVVGLLAMLAHAALHIAFRSNLYNADLFYHVIKNTLNWTWLILPVLAISVASLVVLDRNSERLGLAAISSRVRIPALTLACLLVGLYALYAYLVRPGMIDFFALGRHLSDPSSLAGYIGAPVSEGAEANIVRLGWYLSPLGVLLGFGGLTIWIWRLSSRGALFLGLFLMFAFVFTDQTYTQPHYIYSMRRYVPLVIPGLLVCVSLFLAKLTDLKRFRVAARVVAAGLSMLMLAFLVYTDRVIVPHVEYQGSLAQFQDLNGAFEDQSVLLFSGERDQPYVAATPLEFVFGHDVLALKRSTPVPDVVEGMIKEWEAAGRSVYLLLGTNGGKLDLPGIELEQVREWRLTTRELEQLRDQKPMNIYQGSMWLGVYRPVERKQAAPYRLPVSVDVGGFDYKYLVSGFTEKEQGQDGVWFRWAGEQAALRITGGDQTVPRVLTLRLSAGPDIRPGKAIVKVFTGDRQIAALRVEKGFQDYAVALPPASVDLAGKDIEIVLRSTSWQPASSIPGSKDYRSLGVQVDRVELDYLR